ncbi:MAG: hypothetical protein ACXWC9_09375 [Pseudobdellovibrionaceae bacterium]
MNKLNFKLRNLPRSGKVLVGGFLFCLSLAYVYALLNIIMVVGWTPRDIAIHYYGADKALPQIEMISGEQSIDLNQVPNDTSLGARPSFKNLVQEGHFHLFGMTSFFFCLTLLGLFTDLSSKWKTPLLGIPYIAIVLDNLSFMATRFLGPSFSYLTAVSGAVMGMSFLALWICVAWEVWQSPEEIV